MKKLMMIGKVGCGKTTLTQYLNNKELSYKKTQALEIVGDVIDTPGEYVERRSYYQALAVTSVDVDVVLLLQDPTDMTFALAPGLKTMFQKPMVGAITKVDEVTDPKQMDRARKILELCGAEPIFTISSVTGEGIDGLIRYIEDLDSDEK